MSAVNSLPIYRDSYQLMKLVSGFVRGFSRDFRPTLGSRLHEEATSLIVHVYRAHAAKHKAPHLTQMLECLHVVQLLLQLCEDLRLISIEQHAKTIALTDAIGRQAGGWRKSAGTSFTPGATPSLAPATALPR